MHSFSINVAGVHLVRIEGTIASKVLLRENVDEIKWKASEAVAYGHSWEAIRQGLQSVTHTTG